ncbi:MAG TPA: MucB/RseB C-terminal domain-containing protein [Burkholderiaceae bacterium]|jgi:sigma-E factor negative regulatory protein RseB|nr:MucB/RseB C-terminal domain-containing protein [Burkholderiaceae bacterium]
MLLRCRLFTLACLLAAPWVGVQAAGPAPAKAEPREVRSWLMRIHDAASHRNFQGTFVVSSGGSVSSSRIAHFCEGNQQFERIDALDGQARHVFRHNDVVHTLWPVNHLAVVEQRDLLTSFPALLQAGSDRLSENYELVAAGSDRVAGHEADVLRVKPRDALRYGYRLWADKDSGLLLRAEVLGEHDEVLESSAFSEVTIGVRPQPDAVLQPMRKLEGYRVLRSQLQRTQLEAEGWALKQAVPGFRSVSCVKRPLDGSAEPEAGGAQVLQAIYSDGLTYVSIFIEPFNPQRHTRSMQTVIGATQTMMRRQGDWWITVMGDVPVATLRQFAVALERKN